MSTSDEYIYAQPDLAPLISLKEVSYQYPRAAQYTLLNINLEIYQGEFFGLIGPTGAGKTTLCLALNGIVPQFFGGRFFGRVEVAGLDTVEHPISVLAQHVGQVFEDPETQLLATSVENEVAFALENLKVPREVIRERIREALALVRLDGLEKKHPHELSSGQKQRLAIAAAIAVKPRLLVLDEPTSQLDPAGAEKVFATIQELNRDLGMTIVMASHAAEEMAAFTSRIALIAGGEIQTVGTPDEIYSEIELLERHDLRPPQVASTFFGLRKKGLPIPKVPVRMQQAIPLLGDLIRFAPGGVVPGTKAEGIRQGVAMTEEEIASQGQGAYVGALQRKAPVISIKNLSHVYPDGTRALDRVSLDIHPGEYVLIVGQNGAGKTTLVKHILNLLRPTEGTVLAVGTPLGGKNATEWSISELAQWIGYVAQNPDHQIFNTTVEDEIGYALKTLGQPAEEVQARTLESLQAMGLVDVRDRHPLSLPKGDRARVVIGAILAMKPEVIIFDEPTTGQDYRGARRILELSHDLHRMGKTVIVITHHLYLMAEIAQRVIVMGQGTILLDQDIRSAYYATDIMKKTYLTPPQAVQLALEWRKIKPDFPALLTPQELVDYLGT